MEDGSVDLHKINTKENLADVLTKPINADKFVWNRSSHGLAERMVWRLIGSQSNLQVRECQRPTEKGIRKKKKKQKKKGRVA